MSRVSDRHLQFLIPSATVDTTLEFLRGQGRRHHEGVALWPGRLQSKVCSIAEPLIPQQVTGRLFYRIPDEEVFKIISLVSRCGLVIPIQIHSHEDSAFHSLADDEYAFVQHDNAISIVVPNFGHIPNSEFLDCSRFYRLTQNSEWAEIDHSEVQRRFVIQENS